MIGLQSKSRAAARNFSESELRRERYFGTAAQGWLNLQSAYDLKLAGMAAGPIIKREIRPMAVPT